MTDHQAQVGKQYEAPELVRIAGIEEITLGGPFSGGADRGSRMRRPQ